MVGVYTIQVDAKHNRGADWNLRSLPFENSGYILYVSQYFLNFMHI